MKEKTFGKWLEENSHREGAVGEIAHYLWLENRIRTICQQRRANWKTPDHAWDYLISRAPVCGIDDAIKQAASEWCNETGRPAWNWD